MDDEPVVVNEDFVYEKGHLIRFALGISSQIQQDLPRLRESHQRVVRGLRIKLGLPSLTGDKVADVAGQCWKYQSNLLGYQQLAERLQLVQADLHAGHTASFADFLEQYMILCGAGGKEIGRSTEEVLGEDVEEFIERLREEEPGSPLN